MSKVVVIGGGASGLVAAILASNHHEVILLEANDRCGKKLLLTGNGKCNYWNSEIKIDHYQTDSIENLSNIISNANQEEVFSFLGSMGIYPKIKNGYYYPYSNQATSVRTLLLNEIERRKIKVIYTFKVESILKRDNGFVVKSENTEIICDKVILAAGSKACPKTGSDGSSYDLASSLGHHIHSITPSLTPLKGSESYFKEWNGVRCDSRISLLVDNKKVLEEEGEIQLTDYGISGICTFNISGLATKNLEQKKKVMVRINFLPFLSNSFYNWFNERNQNIPNHTIEELLESILPYKLMFVLLKKANVNREEKWNNLAEDEKRNLANIIENFELEITGYQSFDRAQVVTGGVALAEIDPNTMESLVMPNLYLVGELLDVDGKCGGFNLTFAFISGYLAGKGV
ncbi:MAG: aminoacetone oxidase family FAD-binding enzyme [bacterium]|nr:aminoacetone oxidase family FAD-binding enzyme [bacterium]